MHFLHYTIETVLFLNCWYLLCNSAAVGSCPSIKHSIKQNCLLMYYYNHYILIVYASGISCDMSMDTLNISHIYLPTHSSTFLFCFFILGIKFRSSWMLVLMNAGQKLYPWAATLAFLFLASISSWKASLGPWRLLLISVCLSSTPFPQWLPFCPMSL